MNIANRQDHLICRATRCYCGATGAIVAGAVIAAGATVYSAKSAADSSEEAQEKNAQNVAKTNQFNYRLFREGRGSRGFSQLPLYAKADGQPFEPQWFQDVMGIYDSTNQLTPEEQMARYNEASGQFDQAQAGAVGAVNDLYTGQSEAAGLAANQPVAQARMAAADVKKNSALEQLAGTLNDIRATNARKGYAGDSFGRRMLEFNARRGIMGEAATTRSQAGIQNALDDRGVKQENIRLRLANVGLPAQMRASALRDVDAGEDALYNRSQRRANLFDPFRIGVSNFRAQNLPTVTPVASTGQIVGQGIAATAPALAAYYASNQGNNNSIYTGGDPSMTAFGQAERIQQLQALQGT